MFDGTLYSRHVAPLFSAAILCPRIAYICNSYLSPVQIHDLENGTIKEQWYQLHAGEVNIRKWLLRTPFSETPLPLFGDHEVFGVANEDGIQLWFFNPNFTPDIPDAESFLPIEESG